MGWLLHEVSVEVRPGDRLALVGPSGSGKVLPLRAMARLDLLGEGEIRWQGHVVRGAGVPAYRSQVAYVHQRPALFEGMVEDNPRLPFVLKTHRAGQFKRDRAVELLAALGRNPSLLDKPHRDLSGSEVQITALVRVPSRTSNT